MDALSRYLNEISNCEVLAADEQTKLALLAQTGDRVAQDTLIRTNLRFVVTIALQYMGQGVPLEDLISEGNFGIVKAIERFNPDMGTKFLTYASWWIRQAILQALAEQNRQVRLPANRIGLLQQYNKMVASLEQERARHLTENEVLQELNIDGSELFRQSSVSYHTELEDGTQLLELIPNQEDAPDAELMRESMRYELNSVLQKLNSRERTIVKMYFGIDCPRSYTLEEIGEQLQLTRERIRQLRNKAMKDLRRMNRRKKLENLKEY